MKTFPFWKKSFLLYRLLDGNQMDLNFRPVTLPAFSLDDGADLKNSPETPVFLVFLLTLQFLPRTLSIFWLKYWENCYSATSCCLDHWQSCFTTAGAIVSHGESDDPEYFLGRCAPSCSRGRITAVVLWVCSNTFYPCSLIPRKKLEIGCSGNI